MLKIRLQRVGRRNEPSFRLVVTDSQNSTKSGKSLEVLGAFDSRHGEAADFKVDRIKHWMSMGAKPSDTVFNLLISKKIIEGKKINKLPRKSPIKKEGEATNSAPGATPTVEVKAEPEVAPQAPVDATTTA